MKKLLVIIGIAAMLTACGGSDGGGGGGTAEQQAETSFDDFSQQLVTCLTNAGLGTAASVDTTNTVDVWKDQTVTCNCDGGGTIVVVASDDFQDVTLTASQCTTTSGNVYTGAMTSTDGGTTMNGTMSPFGECSNGTATNINGENCTGSISLQCPAGPVNCNVVDSTTPDECDLSC